MTRTVDGRIRPARPMPPWGHRALAGRYVLKLDKTGRIAIPGAYRHAFFPGEDECVVAPLSKNSAGLFTPLAFDLVLEDLDNDEIATLAHPRASRWLAMSSHYLSVDNQYRIVLPPDIRERVDLGSQIVLGGAYDRIEVWNAENFAEEGEDEIEHVTSHLDNLKVKRTKRPEGGGES
ncbi:MAG: hypothetical protein KDB02_06425 [Acidimicrobiales bacterium]|nr:hypothetical protein [Acidimicrobiales bacterium]